MSRRNAFTLMEMLVVIALITLLMAMLQPSLSAAKNHARTTKCLAQLEQIGRAADSYSVDNSEFVARDHWYECLTPGNGNYRHFSFIGRYSSYLGGKVVPIQDDAQAPPLIAAAKQLEVLRCPSEGQKDYVVTYVTNGVDFEYYEKYGVYTSGAMSKITKLPGSPSAIMYMSEANTINFQSPNDIGLYDVFTDSTFVFMGGAAVNAPRMIKAGDPKHMNQAPLLFFDSHAEVRKMEAENFPIQMFNPLDQAP